VSVDLPATGTMLARRQTLRQLMHWHLAIESLRNLEQSASPVAWASLEHYLGVSLRGCVTGAVDQLRREYEVVLARFRAARGIPELDAVGHELMRFRRRYLQTETLVDFYGDAVNSRTNPDIARMLRAFDFIAVECLTGVVGRLGASVPPVLTYADKGLGASILKANLRLWDGGTLSAVAAVKVTYHNRRRPTALLHECGHQAAHVLRWNEELADTLRSGLTSVPRDVAAIWASWASEIAADAFAFVYAGYASVAALADVVSGTPSEVFRYIPGDPHPVAYLRVLLGIECCRRLLGRGPWDELHTAWLTRYAPERAPSDVRQLIVASEPALARVVELSLMKPARAFGGRGLADLIPPENVSPANLRRLQTEAGPSLYRSPQLVRREAIRIVALTGLRFATEPDHFQEIVHDHDLAIANLGESQSVGTERAAA
jgi:hypothetical protein